MSSCASVLPTAAYLSSRYHGAVRSLAAAALFAVACGGAPGGDGRDGGARDGGDAGVDCTLPRQLIGSPYQLRYDQAGYLANGERWGVFVSPGLPAPGYRVYDLAAQCFVGGGTAGPRVLDVISRAGSKLTGDRADLSAMTGGNYLVVLDDGTRFGPIAVGPAVYAEVVPQLVHFFAAQRCGPTIKAISQHGPCHLFASLANAHSGDGIAVDDGYAGPVTATIGPQVDAEGGWHDAGDYLKFVGTTAYVLDVELLALRDHAPALDANGALAGELRWGLDWLVKMIAGAEPYHQVGGAGDHDAGFRLPDADTQTPIAAYDQRPLFRLATGAGRNLLGRSAAAFALGSQVFASDAAYSAQLLAAAKTTYAAAKTRSAVQNPDPPDFYMEDSGDDDLALAAAVLARATGDAAFLADAQTFALALAPAAGTPVGWDSVDALALSEAALALPPASPARAQLAQKLDALAAPILASGGAPAGPGAAFRYALPSFGDGSLAESLGAAATCLAARRVDATANAACAEVARSQLHWLLGQNPFGVSFLVGLGQTNPQNLHHALAQSAGLMLPGAIVGGPTAASVLTGASLPLPPASDAYAAWSTDELLYEDSAGDYVTNEPAIDFTAALVWVLGELS